MGSRVLTSHGLSWGVVDVSKIIKITDMGSALVT